MCTVIDSSIPLFGELVINSAEFPSEVDRAKILVAGSRIFFAFVWTSNIGLFSAAFVVIERTPGIRLDPLTLLLEALELLDGTEPALEPLDGTEPALEPLEGAEPALELLEGAEPALEPLEGAEPALELLDGTEPALKLFDGAEPALELLDGAEPLCCGTESESESESESDVLSKIS